MLLFVIDFIKTNEKTFFTETNFYANLQFSDKIKHVNLTPAISDFTANLLTIF